METENLKSKGRSKSIYMYAVSEVHTVDHVNMHLEPGIVHGRVLVGAYM